MIEIVTTEINKKKGFSTMNKFKILNTWKKSIPYS